MWSPDGARPAIPRRAAAVRRRRALALILAPAALAACGFRPAYRSGGLYGRVRADDPTDRYGYEFVRHFEARMGLPEAPAYALAYRMTFREEGVAGASADTTTRFQVVGRVEYVLRDITTGRELHRDSASSFTAYSAIGTTISERTAEEAAWLRLVDQLADQVMTGIVASQAEWGQAGSAQQDSAPAGSAP